MSLFGKLAIFVGVGLSSAYVYTAMRGPQGLPLIFEKVEEIRDWQRKNADLKHEVEERQKRLDRLRQSKSEQELEIRKRMKLVRPGETVFVITDKPVPKLVAPAEKQPAAAPVVVKPVVAVEPVVAKPAEEGPPTPESATPPNP